jgi:stage V sporulation protein R
MLHTNEMKSLEYAIAEIMEIANGFGLDYYPMRYEICPAEIIYTFGAYGMPSRFSHWSFGKSFHRMKTQYDLGLSKIYELVINSNPCYAFLLDGNSLIQNKLIVAHVLAHCDFFKNNARFSKTNRNMVESMSAASERISQYEIKFGTEAVEAFLDAVLAIQEHVDPSHYRHKHNEDEQGEQQKNQQKFTEYNDLWNLESTEAYEKSETKRFPTDPEKDILSFIETHSFHLEAWQRDILTMLREEMLYFFPQMETKIMNEGWASYWHIRILRELELTSEETLEFAKLNSAVVQPSQTSLNPYYLGLKIFEDIERRWDQPTPEDKVRFGYKGGQGREKMFEVREFDSDTSFIRSYLTKELVDDLDLYVFEKKGAEWKITDKTWETVRDQLVYSRINGGFPYLFVEDGNYLDNGELYLKHAFEGNELDLKYIERTLPYVVQLWGKPVHLQTTIEDKAVLFSHDGKKSNRRFL